jgi:hypothetical protein
MEEGTHEEPTQKKLTFNIPKVETKKEKVKRSARTNTMILDQALKEIDQEFSEMIKSEKKKK